MKTIRVVAAVICDSIENKNRIFATARGYGEYKGWWEFPGGKIEDGETPQDALVREIYEELTATIKVGDLIETVEYDYPTFHLSMDCFWAEVISGELVLKEAEAAKWLSKEDLENRILRDFNENMNKHLSSVLRGLLPSSMVPVFIEIMEFDDSRQINSVTKEERAKLIELLKAFPFTISGLRDYNEAIVTQGGVSVKDIDPSTLKCKNINGLSFVGEVLDLDAFTGGFNLQIAWSTGYLAGLSI